MSKSLKIMLCVLLISLSTVLCGCPGQPEDAPLALAVVVGAHSNSRHIPLIAETVTSQLYQVAATQGEITIIQADGAPDVKFQTSIPELAVNGLSKSKKNAIAMEYVEQMKSVLNNMSANVPEVDTLEAIRKGADALAGSTYNKILLVLDTGLSSTGYLDFTQGILGAAPETIVMALKDAEALPHLDGITVLWAFCGQTAAPQPDLSEKEKNSLQSIWASVLKAGGAVEVEFLTDFAGDAYVGLPDVSLVEVEARSLQIEIPTTILSDAQVCFKGDSDSFVDEEAAAKALEAVASQLLAHPDRQAYLVGTTASGQNEAYCLDLSRRRAEATRDLLVSRWKIPSEQLTCIGLGCQDPWHVDDLDANGNLTEDAAKNRKVILLDAMSDEAAVIREMG